MTELNFPLFPPCINPAKRRLESCKQGCPLELFSRRVASDMGLTKGRAAMAQKFIDLTGQVVLSEAQLRAIEQYDGDIHKMQRSCARYRGKHPLLDS